LEKHLKYFARQKRKIKKTYFHWVFSSNGTCLIHVNTWMGWLPGTIKLERGKVADYNMVPFFGWICMVVSLRWYKSSEQSRGSNYNMLVDYRGRLLMNNELVSALSNGSLRCKQHRQRWPLMGSASLFCLDLV
jgi:hypothetical protein